MPSACPSIGSRRSSTVNSGQSPHPLSYTISRYRAVGGCFPSSRFFQRRDRPCRARAQVRYLVAEDRSAGDVRDRMGPEPAVSVLTLVRARSARHREPLVRGGHERSPQVRTNPSSPCYHPWDLGQPTTAREGSNPYPTAAVGRAGGRGRSGQRRFDAHRPNSRSASITSTCSSGEAHRGHRSPRRRPRHGRGRRRCGPCDPPG